ncbi:hypothetical protein G6F68_020617 [Rhizopus microsporus]|nr:hypothetical protein G6F68_020617 [Rhizopus microsporus]
MPSRRGPTGRRRSAPRILRGRRGGYVAQPAAAITRHPGRPAHLGNAVHAGQDRRASTRPGLRLPAADHGGALPGAGSVGGVRDG